MDLMDHQELIDMEMFFYYNQINTKKIYVYCYYNLGLQEAKIEKYISSEFQMSRI